MKHLILLLLSSLVQVEAKIPAHRRQIVVQSYNPRQNASSDSTPLQVGNGNFAFGADITGLQTFKPYATLSTWGWHNFSLPTTPNQTSIDDFTGLQWWTHYRLVTYNQPNPAQNDISQWLIQNPQRINLGNIGFAFPGRDGNVTEADLEKKTQTLDLWSGVLKSSFVYRGVPVSVNTAVDPDSDTVLVEVDSKLLRSGELGLFFDFPHSDRNKFDAPFVGVWNATDKHTTILRQTSPHLAVIQHSLGQTTYYLTLKWEGGEARVTGPAEGTHRYFLNMDIKKRTMTERLRLTATFSPEPLDLDIRTGATTTTTSFTKLLIGTNTWWNTYWTTGAFVDFSHVIQSKPTPSSIRANATELQRRTILSLYLLAVNHASSLPPQESGLVNNGWYGKFHLEMVLWNTLHFARWNHFPLFWRSLPHTYTLFLNSSIARARAQGYDRGARWGKMTDPTGRSAPGEINSLLIWQQPHPMYFAETEWRAFPNGTTLQKWDEVISETAEFMVSYAWFNESTGYYDLGPPMYPVSENTNPNATVNPTFELAYWRFGLDVACKWKERQNKTCPEEWVHVRDNLAPLPVVDGTYAVYEGIDGMWTDNRTTNDHPAMAGIYGLLPPPASGQPLDMDVLKKTAEYIKRYWALEESYGWDFSMLAMNALRLGDAKQAVEYLLHPIFQFDDAGYPVGGSRVPTPYFPNSASLLLAVAMMAGGWVGSEGKHFPKGWEGIEVDGFVPVM